MTLWVKLDKHLADKRSERGYGGIQAMVAFSGEVEFSEADPNATSFAGREVYRIQHKPCC